MSLGIQSLILKKRTIAQFGCGHISNDCGESLQACLFKSVLKNIGNNKETCLENVANVQTVSCIFGIKEKVGEHMDQLIYNVKNAFEIVSPQKSLILFAESAPEKQVFFFYFYFYFFVFFFAFFSFFFLLFLAFFDKHTHGHTRVYTKGGSHCFRVSIAVIFVCQRIS